MDPSGAESADEDITMMLERAEACSVATEKEGLLREIIFSDKTGDAAARAKEGAITALVALLVKEKKSAEILTLSRSVRPFFATIAKAKTAKIVRGFLDAVARDSAAGNDNAALQFELCNDTIKWCREEKRTFCASELRAVWLRCTSQIASTPTRWKS